MSGGSLNYLYCKEGRDFFNHLEDLETVEGVLLRHGYADIAKDVRRLIEYIQTAENRRDVLSDQLEDVFHAVEWWLSADYGRDDLHKHLEMYRNGRKPGEG